MGKIMKDKVAGIPPSAIADQFREINATNTLVPTPDFAPRLFCGMKDGSPDVFVLLVVQDRPYRFPGTLDIAEQFAVPQPHHAIAVGGEPCSARRVVGDCVGVLTAIQLDHQAPLDAYEIGDVVADRYRRN
jgi:hypothetical protein